MQNFIYEDKRRVVEIRRGTSLECKAHLHAHLELVYMLRGTGCATLDSKEYCFGPGEALLVFPNQVHSYRRLGEEQYLISIFPPDLCPEYQGVLLGKLPLDPIVRDGQENGIILTALRRILELSHVEEPYLHERVKGYFLILLGEMLLRMQLTDVRRADNDTLRTVLRYCQENYNRDLTLSSISAALHLNRYYISHLFSQKLHMSFCDYIAALRVSKACEVLRTGEASITEVAYLAGFNSPRSFNRVFLRQTGVSPRAYRRGELSRTETFAVPVDKSKYKEV